MLQRVIAVKEDKPSWVGAFQNSVTCWLMLHWPKQIKRPNLGGRGLYWKAWFTGSHYYNHLHIEPALGVPHWGNILDLALWILPRSPFPLLPKGRRATKRQEELFHWHVNTVPPNPTMFHILALAAPLTGTSFFLFQDAVGVKVGWE